MAPIKQEEQFKNELEQRRLEPSTDAWNKLEERLDANEEKSSNRGFWWLGIAASFIGLLLVITFLTTNEDANIVEPTIVDTVDEIIDEEKAIESINEEEAVAEISDEIIEENEPIIKTETIIKKENTKQKMNEVVNQNLDQAVAVSNELESNEPEKTEEVIAVNKSFEEQKAEEVVAKIKALETANASVSEEEIEALLAAAQKEMSFEKAIDEATNTVDADALLRGVEEDLEESFRARVFKLLRSGYEDVKTAVAERNN